MCVCVCVCRRTTVCHEFPWQTMLWSSKTSARPHYFPSNIMKIKRAIWKKNTTQMQDPGEADRQTDRQTDPRSGPNGWQTGSCLLVGCQSTSFLWSFLACCSKKPADTVLDPSQRLYLLQTLWTWWAKTLPERCLNCHIIILYWGANMMLLSPYIRICHYIY